MEGEQEKVRPRVRQRAADGSSREVDLATYRAAKDPQQLQAQIRDIRETKPRTLMLPDVSAALLIGTLNNQVVFIRKN